MFFAATCLPTLAVAHVFHECDSFVRVGAPSDQGDLLCRAGFAVAHNPARKAPDWVAERLTKQMIFTAAARRATFKADPALKKGRRAELGDYRGSGYEPGQMAAAKDMFWDERATRDSFLLSNTAPQLSQLKQGLWLRLEQSVRTWTTQRGELYVFTGPIYPASTETKTIGTGKIAVPEAFFKIVYDPIRVEAISFIIPNMSVLGSLTDYLASVDDVEARTGFDFLAEVRDDVEQQIESQRAPELWR
jgi:endonuclease G